MSQTIPERIRRRLVKVLSRVDDPEAVELVAALGPHRRQRKDLRLPGRSKEQRRATKRAARMETRPLVEAREHGRCAIHALGGCRGALHWDHFFGRGKAPPSVELEWMLCEKHDFEKTNSLDDAGGTRRLYWLRLFLMHAQFYGYEDAIRRTEAKIALEEAQHPERTP